jgi:hypothetical protein
VMRYLGNIWVVNKKSGVAVCVVRTWYETVQVQVVSGWRAKKNNHKMAGLTLVSSR